MRLFGSSCDFFYLYQHIPAHSGHHLLQSPSGMGASIFILQPHHVFIHSTPTGSTQLANGTSSTPQASTYSNGLQPKNAMASPSIRVLASSYRVPKTPNSSSLRIPNTDLDEKCGFSVARWSSSDRKIPGLPPPAFHKINATDL